MRKGLTLILCVAALAGCHRKHQQLAPLKAVAVRADGKLELNLMSFNVRYENPEDAAEKAWPRRVVEAVHLIRREAPDLFGVQEAMHGQAADLWASLPEFGFYGVAREDGRRKGEYAGIFYRRDRFEIDMTDSQVLWLSDTPEVAGSRTWGNELPRIVTRVRLKDRATGRGFYVFNTHWDHKNQPSRERSARFIADQMDHRRHPGEPVVLLGDMNAIESNPGVAFLTGKNVTLSGKTARWENALVDTFQNLHAGQKDRRTLHFWSQNQTGTLKVDHILVSQGATVLNSAIVVKAPGVVSDHFPVTAKVVFP